LKQKAQKNGRKETSRKAKTVEATASTPSRRRTVLKIAGGVAGVVLIALLLRKTDLRALASQISAIGWRFLLVLGVTAAAQLLAVIAWYLSFLRRVRVSGIPLLFVIRLIGESLAQVNPTNIIAGETLKAVLLKKRLGVSYRDGGVSIVLSRIMIVLGSAFLLAVGAIAILELFDVPGLRMISIGACTLTLLLFLYIFYTLRSGHGIFFVFAKAAHAAFGRFAFIAKAVAYLREIDADLVVFYRKKRLHFYGAFTLSVLHRVVGSLEYYVILTALGIDVSIYACVLFDTASMLIRSAGFFIPAQVGLEEFGNKLMFSLVNIPGAETWLTVSLVRRARQIFWILAGFVCYLAVNRIAGKINQDR
jgi:glycosyltransferase 2 family protein